MEQKNTQGCQEFLLHLRKLFKVILSNVILLRGLSVPYFILAVVYLVTIYCSNIVYYR